MEGAVEVAPDVVQRVSDLSSEISGSNLIGSFIFAFGLFFLGPGLYTSIDAIIAD